MSNRDDDRRAESRRILSRAALESDPGTAPRRLLPKPGPGRGGGESDAPDALELWSIRAGRALGLLVTAAIVLWLVSALVAG